MIDCSSLLLQNQLLLQNTHSRLFQLISFKNPVYFVCIYTKPITYFMSSNIFSFNNSLAPHIKLNRFFKFVISWIFLVNFYQFSMMNKTSIDSSFTMRTFSSYKSSSEILRKSATHLMLPLSRSSIGTGQPFSLHFVRKHLTIAASIGVK